MAIRAVPLAVAGAVGVAHGVVLGRFPGGPFGGGEGQPLIFVTYGVVSASPLAAGIVLDLFKVDPQISESLMYAGSALTGSFGGQLLAERMELL